MDDKEQRIQEVMRLLGKTRPEAEAYLAIADGEVEGDIQEVPDEGSGDAG